MIDNKINRSFNNKKKFLFGCLSFFMHETTNALHNKTILTLLFFCFTGSEVFFLFSFFYVQEKSKHDKPKSDIFKKLYFFKNLFFSIPQKSENIFV